MLESNVAAWEAAMANRWMDQLPYPPGLEVDVRRDGELTIATIPVGMPLFHGTDPRSRHRELREVQWVTDHPFTASAAAIGHGLMAWGQYDEARIMRFAVTKPLPLAIFDTSSELEDFMVERGMFDRDTEYFHSVLEPEFAARFCDYIRDTEAVGWWLPEAYLRNGGADMLLCVPSREYMDYVDDIVVKSTDVFLPGTTSA